jgi:hypothetical protein
MGECVLAQAVPNRELDAAGVDRRFQECDFPLNPAQFRENAVCVEFSRGKTCAKKNEDTGRLSRNGIRAKKTVMNNSIKDGLT